MKQEESLSARLTLISPVLKLGAVAIWPILFDMQTVAVTLRVRWLVIGVLLPVAILSVYGVCHVAGGIDSAVGIARRITYGALFAVGFWTASIVLQRWMAKPGRPAVPPGAPPPPTPEFMTLPRDDGPAQYRVRGYDRETRFETEEFVIADSHSNAQMKVELKGVQVVEVERTSLNHQG